MKIDAGEYKRLIVCGCSELERRQSRIATWKRLHVHGVTLVTLLPLVQLIMNRDKSKSDDGKTTSNKVSLGIIAILGISIASAAAFADTMAFEEEQGARKLEKAIETYEQKGALGWSKKDLADEIELIEEAGSCEG